jgi:hypothetical protein
LDTNEKELKQGADTTADLAKQKPQEEVSKEKSSDVSSDEGKLVARMSTNGLRTKRISGAQRKKLVKERNMKEGTWIEKPNTNTPPPQDRGTAGNSGCMKRPLSDSKTPPKKNSNPRDPGAPRCRLELARKLLSVSRSQLCTGSILMLAWIRLSLTQSAV